MIKKSKTEATRKSRGGRGGSGGSRSSDRRGGGDVKVDVNQELLNLL